MPPSTYLWQVGQRGMRNGPVTGPKEGNAWNDEFFRAIGVGHIGPFPVPETGIPTSC